MPITVPTNSWVTLDEADDYLADSVRAGSSWTSLEDGFRERAVISAWRMLIRQSYISSVDTDNPPQALKDAQCELAFELSQNTSVETASSTEDLTKRLKAGSAEIEFFRPSTTVTRFPSVVQELIAPYLNGGTPVVGGFASENTTSYFSDFDLSRGL